MALGVGGWILIAASRALDERLRESVPPGVVSIAGFLVFFGAVIAINRLRCPRCKARLGRTIAMPVAFTIGSGPRINFCPYCGVNLEQPCSAGQQDPYAAQNPIKS